MADLQLEDYLAIALYFVMVLGVGIWASCRASTDNATGYFLAGRTMTWIPIGASTFSTNIGAPMFVGIAGTAAASGIAVVMFEWHAMFMLLLLGWFFLPVYISSGTYTMPEYLKMRFGGNRIRIWLALIFTLLCIISQISGQMYAGALFIQEIFEWDLYTSVALILGFTAIYTVIGGLTAVIWTDTIQTAILIIGSTILAVVCFVKIGSFEALWEMYMQSYSTDTALKEALDGNLTCGMPNPDAFHIFRPADSGDYPWPGMIGGLTILALNAWCTDQICVQRSLSAKNMSHAKGGLLMAAYLKILPFFFFMMPGMVSRVFYPDEVACSDPDICREVCDNPSGCTDLAYPLLVTRVMPNGVRGIMLAALLAALMSSLTSIFNSSSTVFTMDIWRRIRPKARESELMVVGRLYTLLLAFLAIAWLPVLQAVKGSQFWDYSQSIGSFLLPPIVVTFLMGIFWTRTTEKGVFSGLVVGLIIGIIRMGLEWSRSPGICGSDEPDNQFSIVRDVHYLHFAMILAGVVFIVDVAVSLVTQPRSPKQLRRLTYWTRNEEDLPELTDSEDEEEEVKEIPRANNDVIEHSGFKYLFLKYICGVDLNQPVKKLTKEEKAAIRLEMSNISEDPWLRKVMNINAVLCAGVAVFLHAFWA